MLYVVYPLKVIDKLKMVDMKLLYLTIVKL